MSEPLDCQLCGACCMAPNRGHVPVSGDDYERLHPDEQRDLVEWLDNSPVMKVVGERCINLVDDGGFFSCAIYERRPEVCRSVEAGDDACAYERFRVYGTE